VWQGSAGDRRPYADLTGNPEVTPQDWSGQAFQHSLDRTIVALLGSRNL